jgi:hypothetical protein
MPTDIRAVLHGGASLPRRPLDLEAVTLRAKWLAWLRRIRITAVVLVASGLIAIAVPLVGEWIDTSSSPPPAGPSEDRGFVPARPGQPTHVLTDLSIEYPYLAVPDGMKGQRRKEYCRFRKGECRPDPASAGVAYGVAWSTDEFPGDTRCRVTVEDSSGVEVGRSTFSLLALDPSLVRPRSSEIEVDVDGEPDSASAVCEAGDYQPGPGYRLNLIDVKPKGLSRTSLIFDIEFLVPEPDTRMCHLVVHLEDGSTRRYGDFTLTTGPGRRHRFTVRIAPDDIAGAEAPCRTYTLKGDS